MSSEDDYAKKVEAERKNSSGEAAKPAAVEMPMNNLPVAATGPVMSTVPAAQGEGPIPDYPANLPSGIPTRMEQIMDLIGEGKTIWDALVTVFGLHEANYKYLILERTRLTKEEANIVSDAIFVAEHGIGVPPFDFPLPMFADWVVAKLHAFISVDNGKGNARDEFREIASSWTASLRAKLNTQLSQSSGAGSSIITDKGVPGSEP
jgi:hypothetical protein